ncbi:hypothetical protein PIB30_024414 [Stylosanthes scabra]|uniref:Uncharacterized protein n=1 Tax=Stylosanthes scabra TaxID=79078 RepID=A0ABU6UCJ9_9FABA|nr:hypothetical protein [Stylosanthes scabra]
MAKPFIRRAVRINLSLVVSDGPFNDAQSAGKLFILLTALASSSNVVVLPHSAWLCLIPFVLSQRTTIVKTPAVSPLPNGHGLSRTYSPGVAPCHYTFRSTPLSFNLLATTTAPSSFASVLPHPVAPLPPALVLLPPDVLRLGLTPLQNSSKLEFQSQYWI